MHVAVVCAQRTTSRPATDPTTLAHKRSARSPCDHLLIGGSTHTHTHTCIWMCMHVCNVYDVEPSARDVCGVIFSFLCCRLFSLAVALVTRWTFAFGDVVVNVVCVFASEFTFYCCCLFGHTAYNTRCGYKHTHALTFANQPRGHTTKHQPKRNALANVWQCSKTFCTFPNQKRIRMHSICKRILCCTIGTPKKSTIFVCVVLRSKTMRYEFVCVGIWTLVNDMQTQLQTQMWECKFRGALLVENKQKNRRKIATNVVHCSGVCPEFFG